MKSFSFGALPDGRAVTAYALNGPGGRAAVILDYGCTIQSLLVPDRTGELRDVVLGYDTAAEYAQNSGFFGACIGRVGNRIGNSQLPLNGKIYHLTPSEGPNQLHGGPEGFDRQLWRAEAQDGRLVFTRTSPDGEGGYPGNLDVRVAYEWDGPALRITYDAVSDADTAVSLTNHSYFNLCGSGDILGHTLRLDADGFTEIDSALLPTGRILPVAGTPFDFTEAKPVGRDIAAGDAQLRLGGGYDHNFVLRLGEGIHPAARLHCPESGIALSVSTTAPAVQLYTGNAITPRKGRGGMALGKHSGLCLETQIHPDAVHHPSFPSPILRAGAAYHSCTVYEFSAD